MPVSAKFIADFTQFEAAVQRSTVKLRSFEDGLGNVDRGLAKFGNQFSGVTIVREATLAARAIELLGEEGGIAAGLTKLTGDELQRAGNLAKDAAAKLKALGQDVPPGLQAIVKATTPIPEKLTLSARAADLAKSSFGQMFGAFTAVGLVTSAVTGIVNLGKSAFESAGKTADLSAKLGIGTEAIQRMEFVAGQTGSTVDQFASAAFKLGARLSGGSDSVAASVERLGVNFASLQRAKPEAQFERVVAALGRMDDVTKRNEIGIALFGKSFESIAAGVAADYEKLAKLAPITSDAQIQALDRAGDAWSRFYRDTKANIAGLLGDIVLFSERSGQLAKAFAEIAKEQPGLSGNQARALAQERVDSGLVAPRTNARPLSVGGGAQGGIDFVAELKKAEAAVRALTKEQREQIDAANKVGASLEPLIAKYGLSEEAIKLYTGEVRGSTKAQSDFSKGADTLFGRDVIAKAADYARMIGDVANVSKLSRDKQLEVNRVVVEAIEVYRRLGQTAPKAVLDLASATEQLSARSVVFGGGVLTAWKADAKDVAEAMEQLELGLDKFERSSLTIVGDITSRFDPGALKSSLDQMTKDLEEFDRKHRTLGQSVSGGLKGALGDVPGVILSSLTGGGNVGASVGGLFGAKLASTLFGEGAKKAVSSALGSTIGGAIGSVIPGLGTLLGSMAGPLIGKIGGLIKGLFGGPSQKELEGRGLAKQFSEQVRSMLSDTQRLEAGGKAWEGTLVGIRDAYLATGRTAEKALGDMDRLWRAEKLGAEAVKKVIDDISAAFEEQRADTERLNAAIEKYGFTLEELGPTFRNQRLNEQAKELIEDWRVLVASGIDLHAVNDRMAEAIGDYLDIARRTGAEVPIAFRPILQSLLDQGRLVDENGTAITDLQSAGVTFSETMTQGFDRVVEKLQQLIDRLQGAGQAIDDLPASTIIDIQARLRTDQVEAYIEQLRSRNLFGNLENIFADREQAQLLADPGAPIPMARGGRGVVTKPTLFLAGEAGREEVAFSGANKALGGDDAVVAAITRLEAELAAQRRELVVSISRAVGDSITKTRLRVS